MNLKKHEGIIHRCGPCLVGHGDQGFHILLAGSNQIFWLPGARSAYGDAHGRPSSANSDLVALTQLGDHVTFEAAGIRGKEHSFRNWTLEARLIGHSTRDVTPAMKTVGPDDAVASLSPPQAK